MEAGFDSHLHRVRDAFRRLVRSELVSIYRDERRDHIPKGAGVYALYETGNALYAGRTGPRSGLRKRLGQHSLRGSDHRQAPLARALACQELGDGLRCPERYDTDEFNEVFGRMKERVHRMSVRWVEERDPDVRYLLEFYAAKELGTPYNDFRET